LVNLWYNRFKEMIFCVYFVLCTAILQKNERKERL